MAEEKNNASGHLLDLSMIALKKKKEWQETEVGG